MPHQLTRRHLLGRAGVTAACAAMPGAAVIGVAVEKRSFPLPPYVDRQTFFDGKIDWTFYARRREWIGIDRVEETA
ncbi:hypothetical protein [Bradyrhizobium sp. F1.13.3]|uniref:hypothetical protein n=1 Tax=Bradyrhizobium sp. F1.13.3 TaxID=3156351 RepID=UPI00339B7684